VGEGGRRRRIVEEWGEWIDYLYLWEWDEQGLVGGKIK